MAENLQKERNKISELSDSLKKTKKLLENQRVVNMKLKVATTALTSTLQETENKLFEVESYSRKLMKLNEEWQELSMNKYAAVHGKNIS